MVSAACGADLLALSAAAALRLRRRVVLPFDPQRFRDTSVVDRPGNWGRLFDRELLQVETAGELVLLNENPDDAGYAAAGEVILDEAQRIALGNGDRLVAMVIWDGHPRPGVDLTARFRESAARRGFEIVDVPTL